MIILNLYDDEVDLVKRALIELRDAQRSLASGVYRHTPNLCSASARTADRANEVFERLLYSAPPK